MTVFSRVRLRCGSRICVRGGGQPRFCRHRAVKPWRRQKFGPQNGGSGGPQPPPPRSAPADLDERPGAECSSLLRPGLPYEVI